MADRARHHARDLGVVALGGRDLEALLGGVLTECVDDLLARGGERALREVLADQVDRGGERLRLERQQPRGAREVVPVGLGVHLDLIALDLGVEDVGAAAEVHDVQDVDVLAQLLFGHLQRFAQLAHVELLRLARRLDQDAGQRDEAGEALGPDRRLVAVLVVVELRLAPRSTGSAGSSG